MLGPRKGLDTRHSKLAEFQIGGEYPCVDSRAFTKPYSRGDLKLGIPLTRERGELEM